MNNNGESDVIDIGSKLDLKGMKGKLNGVFFFILLLVVALIILFKSIFIVQDGERAVVLRFGQLKDIRTEGINFKIPFIDTYTIVDVEQTYRMEYGFQTKRYGDTSREPEYMDVLDEATVIVNAADNNASIILLELIIQYKISDPVDYLFKVDDLEGSLRIALEDSIRNTYQTYTLEDARTKKELINSVILPDLQEKMNQYEAGIKITQVKTQNVELMPAVQDAYRQKENANQYKKGKIEEADKYENTIIPQAKAESQKLIEEAEAYRAERTANAKASVAEFNALYDEYLKNPAIIKEKYYLEAMESVIKNNEIIINSTDIDDFNVFYNVDDNNAKKSAGKVNE